jgi:membrane fusion protein
VSFKYISLTVFIFCCFLIAFLSSQTYARKAAVPGYLVSLDSATQVVSTRGGIVEKLLVRQGDAVSEGDLIAIVKRSRVLKDGSDGQLFVTDSMDRKLSSLRARLGEISSHLKHERGMLKQNKAAIIQKKTFLIKELTINEQQEQFKNARHQANLAIAERNLLSQAQLDASLSDLLTARQRRIASTRQLNSAVDEIERIQGSIQGLEFQFAEKTRQIDLQIEDLLQQQSNNEEIDGYSIVAQTDGILDKLLVAEGDSLSSTRPIMVIRPRNTTIYARLLIPSRAVGLIKVAQLVHVQYEAFPFQRFGSFSGEVISVSNTIFLPGDIPSIPLPVAESFYLADVILGSQHVTFEENVIPLKPGMAFVADVVLEERSLMEWALDPLKVITGIL